MPIIPRDELFRFYSRYKHVVNYINEINSNKPNNQKIKQIQIPSSLSQSIAYYFISENPLSIELAQFHAECLIEGNIRTYDLIYNSVQKINIEVKATGSNTFQRFRAKVLSADCAIWINFNENDSYDLAILIPNILNSNNKSEVEVDWNNLSQFEGIKYYRNNILVK